MIQAVTLSFHDPRYRPRVFFSGLMTGNFFSISYPNISSFHQK